MEYHVGAKDTAADATSQCQARGAFDITTVQIDEPNIHVRMQHAARLVLQHTGNAAAAVICMHRGGKRRRDGTIVAAKAAYACVYAGVPKACNPPAVL